MKKILYVILALSLVTVSCKNRKAAKEKAKLEAEKIAESETPAAEDVYEQQAQLELEDREVGVALISISRSVCFGVCPAYSAQIFKDGTLIYEGIKNVNNIGKFKGKVSLEQLNATIDEISRAGYFKLESEYDNKNVTDLPTTVTYVNNQGKFKKVVCRYDCDERITKVNKIIDEFINKTKLTKI